MNNRIKELVKQASFEETTMTNFIDGPRQIFYGDEAHMQKFAESIVYDFLSELTNDDALGSARIETIRRLAERYGVLNDEQKHNY